MVVVALGEGWAVGAWVGREDGAAVLLMGGDGEWLWISMVDMVVGMRSWSRRQTEQSQGIGRSPFTPSRLVIP